MQALIGGLGALIAGIIAMMGRKAVVVTASLAALVVLTVAFAAAINLILTGIVNVLDMPVWMQPITWIIPANFSVCFGSIVAGNIARAGYDLAVEKLRLATSAS